MKHISFICFSLLVTVFSFAQVNHIVISQVYGGGGNGGSSLKNDFIELYNPTTSTVSLSGWSLQYASSAGTNWSNQIFLTGSIAPGQYFLVKAGTGGGGTVDLPTPDVTNTAVNMSATAGKLALVNSTTLLTGSGCPLNATVIDFVGFGSGADCREGGATTSFNAPAPSVVNSIVRKNAGCLDANNNSTDFETTAASPRNSASPLNFCASSCGPTNGPTALTLTPSLTTVSGSFAAAAPGAINATNYLVLVSTSSSLTAQPADGSIYNSGDGLGNATVVSYGSSTSFNATGLNPATNYYFYVYSISSSNCFNLVSQLKGNISTDTPPPCTPPTIQATGLTIPSTFSSSELQLNFTRGNGDQVIILYRANGPVDADPLNGTGYTVGSQIGSGNFVGYIGTQNSVTISGLAANTLYHFAIYEFTTATLCYNADELTGSGTTNCGAVPPVTSFVGTSGNAQVTLTWALPVGTAANGDCFDEVLILASTSNITANIFDYAGNTANPVYSGSGIQLVYRGTGTTATVTGLTNGTSYYFRAYSRNGSGFNGHTTVPQAPQVLVTPFDPATGYMYLFGNLHAHSSYSDGNKDDLSKTPKDDYEFARDAQCMDFLGISEHNHSGAGMNYPDYALGNSQANMVNMVAGPTGNTLVTLWGMEWGVSSSGGGHVLIYGFDNQLIGWEAGNYDIFNARNDYTSLWPLINSRANSFAALAHPDSLDFGNILNTVYNAGADNAIAGVAVESGPAFSTSTSYNDFPNPLSFLYYYKRMLAKGYRVAPQMDQDNHNLTFGTANTNRMVVLATDKSRASVVDAIRNHRFYASQDCNAKVDFRSGSDPMGSAITRSGRPSISLTVSDNIPATETVSVIELWGGQPGIDTAVLIKTYTSASSISFNSNDVENAQPNNTTYYYFTIITQGDGNKIVTAPIWYSRSDILPVSLISFKGEYLKSNNSVSLKWLTSTEINTKEFHIERSADGRNYNKIGTVAAIGNSTNINQYSFNDVQPGNGNNFYRLRIIDLDNTSDLSRIVKINLSQLYTFTVSPNPAKDKIHISLSSGEHVFKLEIIDMNGRIVKSSVVTNQNNLIFVNRLNKGLYLVKLKAESGTYTEKLLIE